MKLLALLLVTLPCAAMQKKAAPISKAAPKSKRLTVEDSRFFKQCYAALAKKPITDDDITLHIDEKAWYFRTAEEKAKQYGHAKQEGEIVHGSRDHYLHEGADEPKS